MELKEYKHDLSIEELLIILDDAYDTLSVNAKLKLYEQLTKKYHEKRGFNLYLQTIRFFYKKGFSLGKTTLGIDKDFSKSVKIIDIISRFEVENESEIPVEHAKYLFALIKEFVGVVEKYVLKDKFKGDYKRLSQQLDMLKQITKKSKNNNDIITIFDNVIRKIEESNPLLLEGTVEVKDKEEKLKLEVPLYKLSKKAFLGVLENVQHYEKDDFIKIVEHAIHKYDEPVFREAKVDSVVKDIAVMIGGMKKVKIGFAPHLRFMNASLEKIEDLNYYPLEVNNIDEYYEVVLNFLNKLHLEGTVTEEELFYLDYRFLRFTHHLSNELTQKFLDKVEVFLKKIYSKLKTLTCTKLSELYETELVYDYLEELILSEKDIYGAERGRISLNLSLEEGVIGTNRKGHTVTQKHPERSWESIEVPRTELKLPEYFVIEEVQLAIIRYIKPLLSSGEWSVSDEFRKIINIIDSDILERIEIDFEDEAVLKSIRFDREGKEKLISRILKARMSKKLLTKQELNLILSSEAWIEGSPFRYIESDTVIEYLLESFQLGLLDRDKDEDLAKIFMIQLSDRSEKHKFIYTIFKKLEPNLVNHLSQLVDEDDDNEKAKTDRKHELITRFFAKRLEIRGHKTNNFTLV